MMSGFTAPSGFYVHELKLDALATIQYLDENEHVYLQLHPMPADAMDVRETTVSTKIHATEERSLI